ncbi:MAG: hypothetical protein IT276_07535 [Ignavibacteriaceae bacterium]|jgi:hypothetical protein|nr:hypothetical protein [Ignavibacteriaceae bacterium]
MKTLHFFILSLFLFAVQIQAQIPTDAGIPDANQVLVVYNALSDTSILVKNYYQSNLIYFKIFLILSIQLQQ